LKTKRLKVIFQDIFWWNHRGSLWRFYCRNSWACVL